MKSWFSALHRHFVPSEENGYRPHFLRFKIAAGVLSLIIVLEALYLAQSMLILPGSNYFAAIFASVLVDETNQERTNADLGILTVNDKLVEAAQMKANDMAAKGYFAHDTPDGKTPWYWFDQAGYDYAAAGENLAVNFTDSKDVTDAWMNSPTHRANIMNQNYTEIGIATAHGTYKGKEAIFVVQEFGRPSLLARQIETASAVADTIDIARSIEAAVASSTAKTISSAPVSARSAPRATVASSRSATITTTTAKNGQTVATTAPSVLASTTSTTTVAGAETKKLDIKETAVAAPILEHSRVTRFDVFLASPHRTTTTIYWILAALISIALGLAIFIKIRIQHAHIIANGVLLLAITVSLMIMNAAIAFSQGVI